MPTQSAAAKLNLRTRTRLTYFTWCCVEAADMFYHKIYDGGQWHGGGGGLSQIRS